MIGMRIRMFRDRLGFSQQYVADCLDISQSKLARVESGRAQLAADCLPGLSELLQVDITAFFTNDDTRSAASKPPAGNTSDPGGLNQIQKSYYEKQLASLKDQNAELRRQLTEITGQLKRKR